MKEAFSPPQYPRQHKISFSLSPQHLQILKIIAARMNVDLSQKVIMVCQYRISHISPLKMKYLGSTCIHLQNLLLSKHLNCPNVHQENGNCVLTLSVFLKMFLSEQSYYLPFSTIRYSNNVAELKSNVADKSEPTPPELKQQ